MVGRDLLYGVGFGIVFVLLILASPALHGNNRQPLFPPLYSLLGVRQEVSQLLAAVTSAFQEALIFFFLLFAFRVLLRKQWIAAAAFVAVMALIQSSGTVTPLVDVPISLVYAAVYAFVLLRFGLLAAIVADGSVQMLGTCPPTLDFSSWYIGLSLIPPLVIALIAIYGFRISLAGRPLFKPELL